MATYGQGKIGTAKLADDSVTKAKIAADQVEASEIAADAVDASEIAADAVRASEIQADAVGSDEIAANAVGNSEMADNAVGNAEMADNAVGNAEMADDAVDLPEMAHGTQGDILYYGASGVPARLAAGTAGKVLNTNGPGANPSWESPSSAYGQLASVSLGADATTLTTGAFTAKKHLRVIIYVPGTEAADALRIRFNGDTGTNYDTGAASNGGAPSAGIGSTAGKLEDTSNVGWKQCVIDIFNVAAKKKMYVGHTVSENDDIVMADCGGTWNNTADQITSITIHLEGANDLKSGTEMIVLGMD